MYRYYVGPWVLANKPFLHWTGPSGFVGSFDLANYFQQQEAVNPANRGYGLFTVPLATTLGSSYEEIAATDLREVKPGTRIKNAWRNFTGVTPQGETLMDFFLDYLTRGADPTGASAIKPLMPTSDMQFEFHLQGLGKCLTNRFEWGSLNKLSYDPSNRVLSVLRNSLREAFVDCQEGRSNDANHYRRVLDFWCKKYKRSDWIEFVPLDLRSSVEGPLPHQTTIEDTFERANSASLDIASGGWEWTATNGGCGISSNQAVVTTSSTTVDQRAESSLSTEDNYAELNVTSVGAAAADQAFGPACRFSASARTYYATYPYQNDDKQYLFKCVAGTVTTLTSPAITIATPETYKVEANGSAIKGYQAGVERASATDTAVTGHLRSGLGAYYTGTGPTADHFNASDISSPAAAPVYNALKLALGHRVIPGYLLRP